MGQCGGFLFEELAQLLSEGTVKGSRVEGSRGTESLSGGDDKGPA